MIEFKSVKFTKEYIHNGTSSWIGGEASVLDGEQTEALRKIKQTCDAFNKEAIKQDEENNKLVQVPFADIKTEFDELFAMVLKKLSNFDNKEDAQAYLETTDYKHVVEAKKIVNSKPNKN